MKAMTIEYPLKLTNENRKAEHKLLNKRKSVEQFVTHQLSYLNLFITAGYSVSHKPSAILKIISMIAKKTHFAIYLLNMLMI